MTRVIVDTSLAVKWVLDEEYSAQARAQQIRWNVNDVAVCAPGWFSCEATNVLFQAIRAGRLTRTEAETAIVLLHSFVSIIEADVDLGPRTLHIAAETGQRATYDSYFVALAEHLECELWTADQRFWRTVHAGYPFVRWLGNVEITGDK